MKAPLPPDEAERLEALRGYGILDTLPEQAYDDLTHLASQICQTPIALITLIDEARQWFKSRVGLDVPETHRDLAVCAHAIHETDVFIVHDALEDERFANNPTIQELHIRFYAGAPLITPAGHALGTICVMDREPRHLDRSQIEALQALARQTMAQMELRRRLTQVQQLAGERAEAEQRATDRAQRIARYQSALSEIARLDKGDRTAALGRIATLGARALRVARVGIWLFNDDQTKITCCELCEGGVARGQGPVLDAERYPRYFAAVKEKRVIAVMDAVLDPRTSEFAADYLIPLGIMSMLDVPIWREGVVVGLICHEHKGTRRVWSEEEQEFAASIADMVALVLEAADRREAEVALRVSEASYRAIFDLSNDAIYVHDIETGAALDANMKACVEHGFTREELLAQPLGTLSAREGRFTLAELKQHFARAAGGEPQIFEWLERTRTGRFIWKEVNLRRVHIAGHDRLLATARDITERKAAEKAVRRAQLDLEYRVELRTAELAGTNSALQRAKAEADESREIAEGANRAKSEFLSRMSHELRTPMNSILGFAQVLARKDLPQDQRKAVDHILRAGRHLLALINEVLDISRIEANRQAMSLEPVRVNEVVQETLSLIRPLAAQRGCRVEEPAGLDDTWHVHADRQRLAQVLLNLLSNAAKYNRPDGSIGVAGEAADGRIRIHVRDTGPGIAADKLDQLFVPFERLGAEQSDVEGTGLGLALSKRLVEAMGGQLTVSSSVAVGSTFTIDLPRTTAGSANGGGVPAPVFSGRPADARDQPATLLYIEDNLANLTLIETILANRPEITLMSALQGQIGLDLAWEHHPDVILLDLNLPDLPGVEVLARLRADERTRATPVIVISADATHGRSDSLLGHGAQAYLTKPLDVEQFLSEIQRLLPA